MRIAHPSAGETPLPPYLMAAVDNNGVYEALLRRCRNLEASYDTLSQKLRDLEKRQPEPPNDIDVDDDDDEESSFLRRFSLLRPYKSLLESIGHALQVFKASSGEIIYWNRSAENLYGWREYEVVGRRSFTELLVPEEHYIPLQKIMGRLLRTGEPWSGQFPYRKRSGQVFMALVSKSLLYEDGEVAGVIVVASDAETVNGAQANGGQRRDRGLNFNKIKWKPRAPIAPAPEIAVSVSNLAAKVLAKLQIKGGAVNAHDDDRSNQKRDTTSHSNPQARQTSRFDVTSDSSRKMANGIGSIRFKRETGHLSKHSSESPSTNEDSEVNVRLGKLGSLVSVKESEDDDEHGKQYVSAEDSGSRENPLSEGDIESNSTLVDCEIQWTDLHMGDEIGQGFYAVVYRGIWNGSDVAIKVYVKNEYSEGTLQDYKKEIDIMKRLRHPNVLLFMGAAYSIEKLAIVTEFMPRGSLFKTLHKNNQLLDIRRRLRMALDVARGMNYLHRRNPPIVHRDLKSSNLLVDKNWTVKVGDFGLSKLKNSTFLTAKSGRGTPQWMAPEVLRNEPSNEKSDVHSFGVVLWELITESIPWNNLNSLQVVGIVGFMDRRLDLPEGIEPQIASIIRDCWKSDPAQRPSFEDIIERMSKLKPKLAPATSQKQ